MSELSHPQRLKLLDDILALFLAFCKQEFQVILYDYQINVAKAYLNSLFVESHDVFIKISCQAGKTETLTLLLKFLLVFYIQFTKRPLMSAIASPHGEQAKTDIDRIKKSIQLLRERWNLEDKENNASTIRSYRLGKLTCEMYKFSLAPTTHNESKSLNLLVIEESHQIDDPQRFSYWPEDPLAGDLEVQFTSLLPEYTGGGEYLSPHAPEEPGYYDDACSMTALGCLGASQGMMGEIVIL